MIPQSNKEGGVLWYDSNVVNETLLMGYPVSAAVVMSYSLLETW